LIAGTGNNGATLISVQNEERCLKRYVPALRTKNYAEVVDVKEKTL